MEEPLRLAEFILANVEPIMVTWEAFARSLTPGEKMTDLALRDDAEAILLTTARDMQSSQTSQQRSRKSKGQGGAGGDESDQLDHASEMHGMARVGSGFDIIEVVSEYRALRASVLRLWRESRPDPDHNDLDDVTRFNESIDQSLARAVGSYTARVDQARRMFLAILSHDLRNPLTCIRMAAALVQRKGVDAATGQAMVQIESHTRAVTRLVSDLIDFASSGLGCAMPLTCGPVNLKLLCQEVFDGFCFSNPTRQFKFVTEGELIGTWDAGRLRQVVSNLLGNALQHGAADTPIELHLRGQGDAVSVSVHNGGTPIPSEHLPTLFDPLARFITPDADHHRPPGSIGLGLYIVREIAQAHGGSVDVRSTADAGTTFTVRFPRHCPT